MFYRSELDFFLSLLKEFGVPYNLLHVESDVFPKIDKDIRKMLKPDFNEDKALMKLISGMKDNTVYKIVDEFYCSYVFLRLPDIEPSTILAIGPYTLIEITHSKLLKAAKRNEIDPRWLPSLEKYFSGILYIKDERTLKTAIQVLGEKMWEGADNFKWETPETGVLQSYEALFSPFTANTKAADDFNVKIIENRYMNENMLIRAVKEGKSHRVESMLSGFTPASVEHRAAEPTRNAKNYLIVLNTLMRKAIEDSGVHPIHIDRVSSTFARKIENITSWLQIQPLCKEMAHKYCELVNNHSFKGYSPLIQKVLAVIDFDLTADLSLKTVAETLEVNASYLSAQFKKETNQTLTDFVNKKRVEHACFLLRGTDMPVSVIGQHCGIPDNNYFTKIFKKYTGDTPKHYKTAVRNID